MDHQQRRHPGGGAPCHTNPVLMPCRKSGLSSLVLLTVNGSRYFASLLQLPVPEGEESSGVTPQIFARPLVAAAVAHINKLVKKEVLETHHHSHGYNPLCAAAERPRRLSTAMHVFAEPSCDACVKSGWLHIQPPRRC